MPVKECPTCGSNDPNVKACTACFRKSGKMIVHGCAMDICQHKWHCPTATQSGASSTPQREYIDPVVAFEREHFPTVFTKDGQVPVASAAQGAREFYAKQNVEAGITSPEQVVWTPDGAMRFAESYAAGKVERLKAERDRAIWAKDAISKHAQELERQLSELRAREVKQNG